MLDFHLHLARLPHADELSETLKKSRYRYVCIACEPWEWDKADLLTPESVAYGIHPMIASQISEADFENMEKRIAENPSAAVGECGIDKRFPGYGEDGIQEQVFVKQIFLAIKYERDLQIHCVGDYARIIKLLKQASYPPHNQGARTRPIFHRFGGDAGIIRAALPMGAIFSLHADSFRKKSTAAALAQIPESNIRFETDADETTFKSENAETIAASLKTQLASVQQAWNNIKA